MEKISRADRVRNEVLYRVKGEWNILQTIKTRNANWIGHMLRRNCLLKRVIEGKIEVRIGVTVKTRAKTWADWMILKGNESTRNGEVKH